MATKKTRSQMIESLLTPSFALLFGLFREGKGFAEIVEETGYTPDVVRHARREWQAGWEEPVPVVIKTLDKRLQIKEMELDQTMIERASEERVERLKAHTKKMELEHEVRIERTRALAKERRSA
jgi:hypothetical protein